MATKRTVGSTALPNSPALPNDTVFPNDTVSPNDTALPNDTTLTNDTASKIDSKMWQKLRQLAIEVRGQAYAPYSNFPVGAAALVDDGRIVTGCNVENASYGLTLCAECGLVSSLIAQGGGRLVAFVCVDKQDNLLSPCGRCRQLLYEHGGPELLLHLAKGVASMQQMLPDAFGPDVIRKSLSDVNEEV